MTTAAEGVLLGDSGREPHPNPKDMFYIARNTLAVTGTMSKKAALALWASSKATDGALYQLCKETGSINPVVVAEFN